MELCDGDLDNLQRTLDHPGINESEIRKIVIQISKELEFLHRNKIAHLNLKPQNVLYKKHNKK